MKFLYFLLFITVTSAQIIEQKDPFITTENFSSISFLDENTGYAGTGGTVYRTTDAGASWKRFPVVNDFNIYSITVISAETLIVHTAKYQNTSDIIKDYKSDNGGISWVELQFPIEVGYNWSYFINDSTGFVYFLYGLLRTSDGGATWNVIMYNPFSEPSLAAISFIDEQNGWYCQGGNILRTIDAGLTWSTIANGNALAMKFFTPLLGYRYYDHSIYKTTSGGYNWDAPQSCWDWATYFAAPDIIYQVGGWPNCGLTGCPGVRKSTDGGVTWTEIYANLRYGINASFINGRVAYLAGTEGWLAKTTDGQNFNPLNGGYIFDAAVNGSNVIFAGEYGYIYKSTDYGESWVEKESGTTEHLRRILFINRTDVIAFTDSSLLLRSTDAGDTWQQYSTELFRIADYQIFNNQIVFAVSKGGFLYKTTDAGLTWTKYPLADTLRSVYFLDELTGWISSNSVLYKTTDGGSNWINLNTNIVPHYSLTFFNKNTGGGVRGVVLKTSDGGGFWETEEITFVNWDPYKAVFFSPEHFYVLTAEAHPNSSTDLMDHTNFEQGRFEIVKENNGSDTLLLESYGYIGPQIVFPDSTYGWITAGRKLLRYKSGISVGIDESAVPANYILQQNYPNPFNPSTIIKFSVPALELVVIKIYDILGREIKTLVRKEYAPGTHSVEFNAAEVPSGVYLYKLTAGDYSAVKKMMVIK